MAKRLLGAKLNLHSARHVLNARDVDLSDGGGLSPRCAGDRAGWVFRHTSTNGKRREMGPGTCVRHNAKAAGESLSLARDLAAKARVLLAGDPSLDPIGERGKAKAAAREAEPDVRGDRENLRRYRPTLHRKVRYLAE